MTASTLERPTAADDGFTRSRIKEGDMAHALITLSRQYSRPKEAVIRELATNALESHQAAGYTGPVEIHLPTSTDPFLTITDHGVGLDLGDITEVIGDFAGSTKRHAGQATPNYGIGSKSPYAVADSYTVTAVKDGVRRTVLFRRLADGNPGYKIIATESTVEPNGVTVRVPTLEPDGESRWREAARNILYWWDKGTFQIFGEDLVTGETKEVESTNYREFVERAISTHNVLVMGATPVRGQVTVRCGTTGYAVPPGFFGDLALPLHNLGNLVVETPKDAIKVSPNRESIEDTDSNREQIYAALLEWSETIRRNYLAKLEAATSSYNLFRAWEEATFTERVLTGTTWLEEVGKKYGMATRTELFFTRYCANSTRGRAEVLDVRDVAVMVKSPCLILDELDNRAAGIIAKWRSAHGKPAVYVFRDKEGIRPLIDPDEIEWVTLDDLKAETPTRKSEPVTTLSDTDTVERILYLRGSGQGAVKQDWTVGNVKKLLTNGMPLVIGAAKDFEDLRIDFDKVVAIACASRNPKVIETALGKKSATPAAYMRSVYLQEIASLNDEQKQAYVERATLSPRVLQHAWSTSRRLRYHGDGEWVPYYPEAVLEALKPLSELHFRLDPVYAELPGMPASRLGTELQHTVALLDALCHPSELLLRMALRADKMAAGDRRRRQGKSSGTK